MHHHHRDFISPVLAAALLVARSVMPRGNIFMKPEYHVVGKMGWGPVDYVIWYRTLAVVITEVSFYLFAFLKNESYDNGENDGSDDTSAPFSSRPGGIAPHRHGQRVSWKSAQCATRS